MKGLTLQTMVKLGSRTELEQNKSSQRPTPNDPAFSVKILLPLSNLIWSCGPGCQIDSCAASSSPACSAPLQSRSLYRMCRITWYLCWPEETWLHLTPLFPKHNFQDISTEERLAILQSQSNPPPQAKSPGPTMPWFLSTQSLIFKVAISMIALKPGQGHHSPYPGTWCCDTGCGHLPWMCFVSLFTWFLRDSVRGFETDLKQMQWLLFQITLKGVFAYFSLMSHLQVKILMSNVITFSYIQKLMDYFSI